MGRLAKTKIVATLGPATSSKSTIELLIKIGVNVFRINASHGSHDEYYELIKTVNKLSYALDLPVAILLDIQGPKIRVGSLFNGAPVELIEGNDLTITSEKIIGNQFRISTNYPHIANDVKVGDKILLNDGLFQLQVLAIDGKDVKTKILSGGYLEEKKGVNIPGTTNSLSVVTEKDIEDIKFGVKNGVDFLGLSFIRTRQDIEEIKGHIKAVGGSIPVIAKIEKPQAVKNIDEIIEVVDGVMIARGDLGIELDPEKVPMVQKEIIGKAIKANKFVITATQMLESMIHNPLPTRAEVSDVANAILDGTDAIMLSGETSVGKYPVESVKMMSRISEEIIQNDWSEVKKFLPTVSEGLSYDSHAIAISAVSMAEDLKPDALIVFTCSGFCAKLISRLKPSIPIFAITHRECVYRQLSAYWGVKPYLSEIDFFGESLFTDVNTFLKDHTILNEGDKVIIVGGTPYLLSGMANFIKIHTVK